MKKVSKILAASICFLLLLGGPAYAGSLNANEQELVSIISGTYTYEGVTYKVKDVYVQQAIDYLMQDGLDTTDEQKQKAINKMYSSIQQGIDEGYLEPVLRDEGNADFNQSATGEPENSSIRKEAGSLGEGATEPASGEKKNKNGADSSGAGEQNSQNETDSSISNGWNGQDGFKSQEPRDSQEPGAAGVREQEPPAKSPVALLLEQIGGEEIVLSETAADTFGPFPDFPWKHAWLLTGAAAAGSLVCLTFVLKWKERQRGGKGLIIFMALGLGILLMTAMFQFGLYRQDIISRSFELSGYYEERFGQAERKIRKILETAGLSGEIPIEDPKINPSSDTVSFYQILMDAGISNVFERRVRDQVFGRTETDPMFLSLNLDQYLNSKLKEQKIQLNPDAEQGLAALSGAVRLILAEESTVPGLASWWEQETLFADRAPVLTLALSALVLFDAAALLLIRKHRYHCFSYLSAVCVLSVPLGFLGIMFLMREHMITATGTMENVLQNYIREFFYAGIKIGAAVLLTSIFLWLCGRAMKRGRR